MSIKKSNKNIFDWETTIQVESGCVVIPGKFTVIAGGFSDREDISEVIINDGVKMVDEYVFKGCVNLTSATLPSSLVFLGNDVFSGCKNLKNVNIANGVIEIPARAFKGCSALEAITIPDSVRWISSTAFEGCDNLKELKLPKHLTKIIEESQISYLTPQSDAETEKAMAYQRADLRYEYIYSLNMDQRIRWLTNAEITALSDIIKVLTGNAPPEDYWIFQNLTGSLPWFYNNKLSISRYGDEGIILYNGANNLYECYDMSCSVIDFESQFLLDAYDFAIAWNEANY